MMLPVTWLGAISDGTLLAGVVIGTWEFGEFLMPWLRRWGPGLAAILAPWGLLLAGFSGLTVPWGVYAVGVASVWLWEPWDIAVEATGSFAVAWEVARLTFGGKMIPFLLGFGALVVFAGLASLLRKKFQKSLLPLIGLYMTVVGCAMAFGIWYPHRNLPQDLTTIAILGMFLGVYSVFRTHRSQRWETVERKASEDALTRVLTRYGLATWLLRHEESMGAVMALDLDNFKPFNDTWGHAIGDFVLQTVALRIQSACRQTDAIVRPGGDEFVIWMPHLSPDESRAIAYRIHQAVTAEPIPLPGELLPIQMSIGWALGPMTMTTAEAADQALLTAKRRGKNQVVGMGDPLDVRRTIDSPSWMLVHAAEQLWTLWPQAAALTDVAGNIITANPAYEQLTGRKLGDLVGRKPGINSAGQTPSSVYADLWQRVLGGGTWHGVLLNQRPNGDFWWAREHIHPVLGEDRRIMGYWSHVTPLLTDSDTAAEAVTGLTAIVVTPVFQPIIVLETGAILGYEVLSRARIGNHEISPDQLFALATAVGHVPAVDLQCLEEVVRNLEHDGEWPATAKLFVNVRAETLADFSAWQSVASALNCISPAGVVWELSEQSLPTEPLTANLCEAALTEWAIDDWGTGWHPLPLLKTLNPRWVKIDRTWIQSAMQTQAAAKLLQNLLQWAREQGIHTVAEGVETAEDAEQVAKWGFSAGQGYYWGRPTQLKNLRGSVTNSQPSSYNSVL